MYITYTFGCRELYNIAILIYIMAWTILWLKHDIILYFKKPLCINVKTMIIAMWKCVLNIIKKLIYTSTFTAVDNNNYCESSLYDSNHIYLQYTAAINVGT
jgi:hypothetical protein